MSKRVRGWCKPDDNADMKRAKEISLEVIVRRTHTCDMGLSGRNIKIANLSGTTVTPSLYEMGFFILFG